MEGLTGRCPQCNNPIDAHVSTWPLDGCPPKLFVTPTVTQQATQRVQSVPPEIPPEYDVPPDELEFL
jgi:hypothetical protein